MITDQAVSAEYLETIIAAYEGLASADDVVEQLSNEEQLRQYAYDKSLERHASSARNQSYSDTKAGRWAVSHLVQNLADKLSEVRQTMSGRRGTRNIFLTLFETPLSDDQLAYLTIKQIVDSLALYAHKSRSGAVTLKDYQHGCPALSLEVATINRIWEEIELQWASEKAHYSFQNVMKQIKDGGLSRSQAMRAVQRRMSHHEIDYIEWKPSTTEKAQIGMHLINYAIEATGMLKKVEHGEGYGDYKAKSKVYYELEIAFAERLFATEDSLCLREVRHEPMVVPPIPWSADNMSSGPYLHPLSGKMSLTKRMNRNTIREFLNGGNHETLIDTINAIQEVPYVVNNFVRDAIRWAANHDEQGIGKLPQETEYTYPEWNDEWRDDPAAKGAWIEAFKASQKANAKRQSQAFALRQTLAHADKHSDRPLWFPLQLDARGRSYPLATYGLSPQGSGYQKALLQSYEGFEINDRAALNRLYFQCATEGEYEGVDKASTAARVKWVEDNLETIKAVGEDFRNHVGFWSDAPGSPWMFLAACHEIAEFHRVGYGYKSRLFCYQDATCSGLQVFSALGRDELGGYSVNLIPGHDRQDIYELVAERAISNLKSVSISSLDENLHDIHRAVVEHGLNRKSSKRQVMTRPYNSKQRSCTDYTHEWYKGEIAEGRFVVPEGFTSFDVSAYASKAIWNAIGEAIPAANQMMLYIEECVKVTVKANPEAPIQWKLADGMVCVIDKREQGEKPIQTRINSLMHKRTMKVDKITQSTNKHGNAAPPNFIHSLDALHLRETARMWEDKCASAGRKPVYTFVHDSFGVPAADMTEFSLTIREAFVRIHSDLDLMASFVSSLQELAGPDVVFPERPALGTLDIEGVLQSEFFFS